MDYDIEDPSEEQWARPTCPVCGVECEYFSRYTPQEDGTVLYG
ncbi:hypothetical protein [Xanthomonas indica]|nr:hypothetical protein [Xanthomonas indica]